MPIIRANGNNKSRCQGGFPSGRTPHWDRMRRLPGSLPIKAIVRDFYRMACRSIRKLVPNGLQNWSRYQRPTRWLSGVDRDVHWQKQMDILQKLPTEIATEKSTKNVPKLSCERLTEQRSIETLLNEIAKSRNAEICKYIPYSGFPKSQERLNYGEYDHLLRSLRVWYAEEYYTFYARCNCRLFYHPWVVTGESHTRIHGYDRCRGRKPTSMPKSQDEVHVMIDVHWDYPDKFRRWSMRNTALHENIRNGMSYEYRIR
jgi:hypothetical protein